MEMPDPDAGIISRRAKIIADLGRLIPDDNIITSENELRVYECDGLSAYRQLPLIVVLPETTEQVARILLYCHENDIRVVPRGSGTSLAGGAVPLNHSVCISTARMKRILHIDLQNELHITI